MLRIMKTENGRAAVLCCAVCGGQIIRATLAAVVFRGSHKCQVGALETPMIVHKGRCHDQAEASLGGKSETGWLELSTWLAQLYENAGVGKSLMRRQLEISDELR